MNKTNNEIGSEFCYQNLLNANSVNISVLDILSRYKQFYLSGRTALDAIIKDIKIKDQTVKKVCLPDYCCDSMIQPFIDNDLEISFYRVEASCGTLHFKTEKVQTFDILYVMEYFGYALEQFDEIFKFGQDKVIIQDCTHSIFQKRPYSQRADYYYVSFRKWEAIPAAAIAVKKEEPFYKQPQKENRVYIDLRNTAFESKRNYLFGDYSERKEKFLSMFNQSEEMIDADYADYKADKMSVEKIDQMNYEEIGQIRRRNALYLLKGIQAIRGIQPIFDEIKEGDCPLFVPVLVDKKLRLELRNYLIKHLIYCPIHWPLSSIHLKMGIQKNNLYDEELSLVCDQRYSIKDMERIISTLKNFEKELNREV